MGPRFSISKQPAIKERRVSGSGTKVKSESYEQVRRIGAGGQGKVWIVKRKSDKKVLVRKEQKEYTMLGEKPMEQQVFERFIRGHPRIIEFDHANFIAADHTLVLYFEHCQGGDLHDYIPRYGEKGCSERFLWSVFVQLAEAVAFLHYGVYIGSTYDDLPPRGWCRVIHRDIKPENVFLRYKLTDKHPVPEIVLGDFGLATMMYETSGSGTPRWMAPEIPLATPKGDVWGIGACIHALAHGRGPVPSPPSHWPRGKDAEREWERRPSARQPKQLSTYYSSALNRNMMDCLEMEMNRRVDSDELLKHLVAERPRPRR